MKSIKPLHILMILFICFQIYFSQEKPKPRLIDEIPKTDCDDISARVYGVRQALEVEPNVNAYIITYGDENNPLEKYYRERILKIYLTFLQINPNRLFFLHGKDKKDISTQLWIVPEGADIPIFEEAIWDYKAPQITKSFLIHKNSLIEDICPLVFSMDFYSKLLAANSNFSGHLVIYAKTIKKFRQTEDELLDDIVGKYKISRNQIKISYVKSYSSDVEFWIIPYKQR